MPSTQIANGRLLDLPATATRERASPGTALVVPLFTATLFVSAFLLFLIQPMVAKMVLPRLGGSPMVWNTCMVFFQIALLAGYAYAHASTKWLQNRVQVALHLLLVLLPFAVLPFAVGRDAVTQSGSPITWLLLTLGAAIGLPFFVLATSASVLQSWFSRTHHRSAEDPYFLYVASNVGSFAALAAYPVVVEPVLALRDQSRLWMFGYAIFVALVGACAAFAWRGRQSQRTAEVNRAAFLVDGRQPAAATDTPAGPDAVTFARRMRWVVLAFVPSSLMLAVTTYLSTDIASVPLLWVVPLGLYLLTFIAAFSAWGDACYAVARRLFPLILVPLVLCMGITGRIALLFPLHLGVFVAAALLCHARLAADRPAASQLTEFYLWVSFGGMVGGLFNGLAAPQLFDRVLEYPLVLVLACAMLPSRSVSSPRDRVLDVVLPLAVAALTLAAMRATALARLATPIVVLGVPGFLAFTFRRRPVRFALGIAALLMGGLLFAQSREPQLYTERTFFGVYRVQEDRNREYRALAHGTTLHGMEAIAGPEREQPLLYFSRGGPFGQAIAARSAIKPLDEVAVIGLGIGSLAAYAGPDERWTYYEIDEAVERIARNTKYFHFLERCGHRCRVEIGDARLTMARASQRHYDLIALDAFSSDSIPVHLVTSEALSLYLRHLRDDGVIVFHISNRHLDLSPILGRLAGEHRLVALRNYDRRQPDWPQSRIESIWVAMARDAADLGSLTADSRWKPIDVPSATPLWTDDFSNILSVLRF